MILVEGTILVHPHKSILKVKRVHRDYTYTLVYYFSEKFYGRFNINQIESLGYQVLGVERQ